MATLSIATPLLVIAPNFPEPQPVRPSVARWRPELPAGADFGGAIRLAGFAAPATATPGATVDVQLYWEMLARTSVDHSAFVHIVDAAGERQAQGDGPIGTFEYGTTRLVVGESPRSSHRVALPTALEPGRYTLVVGVYPSQAALERLPVVASGQGVAHNALRLAPLDVTGPPPAGTQARAVLFGGALELAAARLPGRARPGDPLAVELEWRTVAPPGRDYSLFLHLVDGSNAPRAQNDGPLTLPDYPVGRWHIGDLLRIRRTLAIPPSLPPGRYRLLVGLYDPAQPAARLPITRADVPITADSAELGVVEVGT